MLAFALEVAAELPARGITGLYGRSGSGKTTLLRCIAGLERGGRGTIAFNGATWQHERQFVPAHQRGIGYVFQESSLFPHLDVRGNLEYGFKRVPQTQRRLGFDDAVACSIWHRCCDSAPPGCQAASASAWHSHARC